MKKSLLLLVILFVAMPLAHSANDLSFFGLKGNVKSVNVVCKDSVVWDLRLQADLLKFNRKGVLVSGKIGCLDYKTHKRNVTPATLKRHHNGKIKTFECRIYGDVESVFYDFYYDKKGLVNKSKYYSCECYTNETYTYNSEGLLESSYSDYMGDGDSYPTYTNLHFYYTEFDSHGNWTKVEIDCTQKTQDYDGKAITETSKGEIHRTITYY